MGHGPNMAQERGPLPSFGVADRVDPGPTRRPTRRAMTANDNDPASSGLRLNSGPRSGCGQLSGRATANARISYGAGTAGPGGTSEAHRPRLQARSDPNEGSSERRLTAPVATPPAWRSTADLPALRPKLPRRPTNHGSAVKLRIQRGSMSGSLIEPRTRPAGDE
jgi:hypothetical protein